MINNIDAATIVHETYHYQQMTQMGYANMFTTELDEVMTYGLKNVYTTPGTLEYDARMIEHLYAR